MKKEQNKHDNKQQRAVKLNKVIMNERNKATPTTVSKGKYSLYNTDEEMTSSKADYGAG